MSAELIGSIRVSPTTAQPGETVKVEVLNPTGQLYRDRDDTRITINGVPGSGRYLQFKGAGERTVRVRAVRGAIREKAQATVRIAGDPLTFQAGLDASTTTQFARLRVRQVPRASLPSGVLPWGADTYRQKNATRQIRSSPDSCRCFRAEAEAENRVQH